jgi:hypothetical protein
VIRIADRRVELRQEVSVRRHLVRAAPDPPADHGVVVHPDHLLARPVGHRRHHRTALP